MKESTWVIYIRYEIKDMQIRIYNLFIKKDLIELDDELIKNDFKDFFKVRAPRLGKNSDFYIFYYKADRINKYKSLL